jgi:hypothetical protein
MIAAEAYEAIKVNLNKKWLFEDQGSDEMA